MLDPARYAAAAGVLLRHERVSRFRWWGLFELFLKILAAIVLIPFWIYLLFVAMQAGGDADGGDAGGAPRKPKPEEKKKSYGTSSLFSYHHELVLELVGVTGEVLESARHRLLDEAHARRTLGSILSSARANRLDVVESVDVAPGKKGPAERVQQWRGGQPLMAAPDVRSAAAIAEELRAAGFEIEADGGNVTLRRVFAPASFWVALLVAGVFAGGYLLLGVVGTPLSLVVATPAILFALWLLRRELWQAIFALLCALFRFHERHELQLTPRSVTYRSRRAWRRHQETTEGSELVAVGYSAGLTTCEAVRLEPPQVRIVGREHSVVLPARFSEGVGPLLAEWVTATLLAARPRCGYCGRLHEPSERACPACGAAL